MSWWTVARSEEVNAEKPIGVDIGARPIVLWRDREGIVRALEDRCPHRRAPLSLGCVRDDGALQCGYHGWTYDGATGNVIAIPNVKEAKRFPPMYRAESYAVQESDGFIRVSLDPHAAAPVVSKALLPLGGTSYLSIDHERYLAALFDDPSLVLTIRGVQFTTYLMSDVHEENGRLVMERNCQWKLLHWPAPFSAEYPLTLLLSTAPATGETDLILRNRAMRALLTMTIAPVPAARGVTAVRWRVKVEKQLPGSKLLNRLRPVKVHSEINGAALRRLKPSVSIAFENLRSEHALARECVA